MNDEIKIPNETHVRCYLKCGITVEGIVKQWSKNFIQIYNLGKNSISVIHDPKEIFLTQYYFNSGHVENEDLSSVPEQQNNQEEMSNSKYGLPGFFTNENTE